MAKMTNKVLVDKAIDIVENYKTSYIWGGLGRPITEANLQKAVDQYSKNVSYAQKARRYLGHKNAFYFDCVGLIKAILWGWCGDFTASRGGAIYGSNGVPDISADTMITKCSGVSTNFDDIEVGEALWCAGHIGIYIGDGLGVECTPSWSNGVQVTAVGNIGSVSGYNTRKWTKHGKLPYVDYVGTSAAETAKKPAVSTESKPATPDIKTDPARSFDRMYAKTYSVTASGLNMRTGAGTTKRIIKVLKHGEKVTCYGYFTINGSTIWLYVKDESGQTGFVSKKYLK